MEPIDYANAIRRRWITIVALAVIGAIVGFGYASTIAPQYRASSSVFVSASSGQTNQEAFSGTQYAQDAVQSYVQLAGLSSVLQPVITKLGLTETTTQLAKQVTATAQLSTTIITISVIDTNALEAQKIAQATAQSLVKQSESLATKAKAGSTISMSVVDPAALPASPFSPNKSLIAIIGAVVGLIAAILYALVRSLLDTRITSEEDLARATDAPLLGRIARTPRRQNGLVMRTAPHSTIAEEYRRLRTNLEYADVDNPVRAVVVTSGLPGEGKSTTAVNLALAMAEQSKRVLLIDADLRKPSVASYTGLDGGVGLTSVLIGSATLDQAIQTWGDTGLQVLPSGATPPNPNQLISSDAMATLLRNLREAYDYVVIDAPPLLPVTDALTLTGLADGAIVVALNRSTKRPDFTKALESLELVNVRTLGVVLNQAKALAQDAYYGYKGTGKVVDLVPTTEVSGLRAPTMARSAEQHDAERRDADYAAHA